jgi:hypothetical protein
VGMFAARRRASCVGANPLPALLAPETPQRT